MNFFNSALRFAPEPNILHAPDRFALPGPISGSDQPENQPTEQP